MHVAPPVSSSMIWHIVAFTLLTAKQCPGILCRRLVATELDRIEKTERTLIVCWMSTRGKNGSMWSTTENKSGIRTAHVSYWYTAGCWNTPGCNIRSCVKVRLLAVCSTVNTYCNVKKTKSNLDTRATAVCSSAGPDAHIILGRTPRIYISASIISGGASYGHPRNGRNRQAGS